MTTQAVSLLSILRGYMKACIPFTAILLSLASSSLTLADSNRAYVRVWTPTGTQSIKIVCGDRCKNPSATWCASNVPWQSALDKGEYHDFGMQGQVGHTLSITAYSQSNCQGQTLGRASTLINDPGDCWFDIPGGVVSGACNGTTESVSPTGRSAIR